MHLPRSEFVRLREMAEVIGKRIDHEGRGWPQLRPDGILVGLVGEWCFSKVYDLPMQPPELADPGWDFRWHGGLLDVKTSTRIPPWLKVPAHQAKEGKADWFVLAHWNRYASEVMLVGCAGLDAVRCAPIRNDWKYPCHLLKHVGSLAMLDAVAEGA